MNPEPASIPELRFRAGRLLVEHWPAGLRPPHELVRCGDRLEGPARLRPIVRERLQAASHPFTDTLGSDPLQQLGPPRSGVLLTLHQARYRGLLGGISDFVRSVHVVALANLAGLRAVVAVADSGAELEWRRTIAACNGADRVAVDTVHRLASCMHALGGRHDLIAVDGPERMPFGALSAVLDASAALGRIGYVDRVDMQFLQRLARGLGPLLVSDGFSPGRPSMELRVPLPAELRPAYESAWCDFLGAFDRFAAARPGAGFDAFVAAARADAAMRPALHAYHRAVRVAAWHANKREIVAQLVLDAGDARVLVFLPDRRSAYELAATLAVPAVTAELPRAEREHLLTGFRDGRLRVLVGPRLLDTGVPEASADVLVVVGPSRSRAQRLVRLRRAAPAARVYDVLTTDTQEVGSAHRQRAATAGAAVPVDHG
ncbi:MAG: helicase-related protein [Planctomycetota bacterium]